VGGREEWRAASRQMDIVPADLHLYPLGLPKAREGKLPLIPNQNWSESRIKFM